ncbi:MAG: GxxExxY protein [Burkholderiales bacterium]
MDYEEITGAIISAAMKVHSGLGPGLLESVYEACLEHELRKGPFSVARQVEVPVVYDGLRLESGFRLDLLVAETVVVEIKAIDRLAPIHTAQLLTYLKLTKCRVGLLLNFNVVHMRDGIKRIVHQV